MDNLCQLSSKWYLFPVMGGLRQERKERAQTLLPRYGGPLTFTNLMDTRLRAAFIVYMEVEAIDPVTR